MVLAVLVLFTGRISAQTKPEEMIARFFEIYKTKGSDEAIDFFFTTNKYLDKTAESAKDVKDRLKKAIDILQTYYGYEIITKKTMGESLILIECMVKYDRQPIEFSFTLYKPDKEWHFHNIKFNYKLEDDLKNAPNSIK